MAVVVSRHHEWKNPNVCILSDRSTLVDPASTGDGEIRCAERTPEVMLLHVGLQPLLDDDRPRLRLQSSTVLASAHSFNFVLRLRNPVPRFFSTARQRAYSNPSSCTSRGLLALNFGSPRFLISCTWNHHPPSPPAPSFHIKSQQAKNKTFAESRILERTIPQISEENKKQIIHSTRHHEAALRFSTSSQSFHSQPHSASTALESMTIYMHTHLHLRLEQAITIVPLHNPHKSVRCTHTPNLISTYH